MDRDELAQIASATNPSEPLAAEQLLPLVYEELRKLAAQKLAREKPGQTLQATALVHEAYVRITDSGQSPRWNSQGHFFAAAAEAIRRILIERARHRHSLKAGGERRREDLPEIEADEMVRGLDLLALDEALEKLEKQDKRRAELVKLRFFAGLTIAEAAGALGIATSTADNDWAYARCWLRLELEGNQDGKAPSGAATTR
jgi:RNA polymerase sigma factor (TIGR02999 family)